MKFNYPAVAVARLGWNNEGLFRISRSIPKTFPSWTEFWCLITLKISRSTENIPIRFFAATQFAIKKKVSFG